MVLTFGIFALCFSAIDVASSKPRDFLDKTVKPCSRYDKDHMEIVVKCKDDSHVIIDLDIVPGLYINNRMVTGFDTRLRVQQNECYGNTSCTFQFPTKDIFMNLDDNIDPVSISERSTDQFVHVSKAKCAPKKDIQSLCDTNTAKVRNRGFLRSHKLFPWNYKRTGENCSMSHVLDGKRDLVVEFQGEPEIDELDSLTLFSNSKSVYVNDSTPKCFHFKHDVDKELNIDFNIDIKSKGASGFLLCYKKVMTSKKTNKRNCTGCNKRYGAKNASVAVVINKDTIYTCLESAWKKHSRLRKPKNKETTQSTRSAVKKCYNRC